MHDDGRSADDLDVQQVGVSVGTNRRRLPFSAVAVAIVVLGLSGAVLLAHLGSADFQLAVTDLTQLGAAAAAAVSCALAARRQSGRLRVTWTATAVACAGWAAGETVWSWYELGRGIDTPFPSAADIGFLVFPVGAAVALLSHPARGSDLARGRRSLDALVATGALALVTWQTALGAVLGDAGENRLAMAVALAYPLSDVVLLILIVLTLSGSRRGSRLQLALLAAGIAALSVSDSGFAYLTSIGSYDGGGVDLGWVAGFLLIGLAALARDVQSDEGSADESKGLAFLPYASVGLAGAVTIIRLLLGTAPTAAQTAVIGTVVVLVLARQYLMLRENSTLVGELALREAQLRHQAFHDALTGLANRGLFQDRLGHALDLHSRDLRAVSVLFLDLDDFKLINDTLGHGAGDELLVRVAERLVAAVRTGDTVARLGGDEFAILLEDGGDPVRVAAAVEKALATPFVLSGTSVRAAASIGLVAVEPEEATTSADVLLARADTAMYTAKRSGKGQLRIYEHGMSLVELVDQRIGTALAEAIGTSALTLAYQPVVNIENGRVVGVEALARWRHDDRDVPPSEFIPIAERTGVIEPLTAWVLDEACSRVSEWARSFKQLFTVAVNVSPPQMKDPAFVDVVTDAIARHRLRRGQLILEITESSLLDDIPAATEVVRRLRDAGVRIALDDFGVGFSSLSQLHAIELDVVKIDRAFIDRLDTDPRQVRFLRSLLRLGLDLGLEVVAEGVERHEQFLLLRELDCRMAQGYLLARPLPPEALRETLAGLTLPALRVRGSRGPVGTPARRGRPGSR